MLKDLLKEGGLYTIANLLTKGVSLMLIPFYTSYFTPLDYGILDMLTVFGVFFNAIVSLQLSQGLGRYVGDSTVPNDDKKKYASTAILFTSLLYLVFVIGVSIKSEIFINFISSDILIEQNIFLLALISIMINGIFYNLGVYIRFLRLTKVFSVTSFIHAIGNIVLTLVFVLVYDTGILGIFYASIIVAPLIIIFQLFFLRGKLFLYIGKSELKKLIKYSTPLIPAALAYALLNFTDRIFINEYISTESVGIYGIGAKFASVVALILTGFSMALNPIILHNHNNQESNNEFSKIFKLFIVLGSLGVLVLSFFSKETLIIFTQKSYYDAYLVMPILYFTLFLTGLWMFSPGLVIKKKTITIGGIVLGSSLLNILLNYILIQRFNIVGTAIATLISVLMNNVLLFYFSNKYYEVKFPKLKVLFLGLIFSVFLYVGSYLIDYYSVDRLNIVILKILLLIVYVFVIIKINIIDKMYIQKLKQMIGYEKK